MGLGKIIVAILHMIFAMRNALGLEMLSIVDIPIGVPIKPLLAKEKGSAPQPGIEQSPNAEPQTINDPLIGSKAAKTEQIFDYIAPKVETIKTRKYKPTIILAPLNTI